MNNLKNKVVYFILSVSFLGFLDALVLSYSKIKNVNLPCSITNNGCEIVANSAYSSLFGIPLAYWGVLFYVSVFALAFLYKKTLSERVKYLLVFLIVFGAIDSLYFMYLQAFVIKAFCIYCILSALASFSLFFASLFLLKESKTKESEKTKNSLY